MIFNINGVLAIEAKTEPVLIVHPNRPLPFSVSEKRMQLVSRRSTHVFRLAGLIELQELANR